MSDKFVIEISAEAVAWYGAIVATAAVLIALGSFWVSLLSYLRDRPKIKIRISNVVLGLEGDSSVRIMLEVANHGNRPTTITSFGFRLSNKNSIWVGNNYIGNRLPYKLRERESIRILVNKYDLLALTNEEVCIKYVWFKDATDKEYKVKFPFKINA